MPAGSGLSGSLGIATETTYGVPVPVTRFVELDSESLAPKKGTYQGSGLRQGGLVRRAQRRINISREAAGDVQFDPTTNQFGLWLQHMLGSFSTTPTSIGGGLYRQIHNIGTLQGKSFTTQVLRPDTTGVLAQQAFTYPGCKVTDWELSVAAGGELKAKVSINAMDEATPSNAFANTTLSAASTVGAVTITTVGVIPAGSWITIDTGLAEEVVQTGTQTGAGPYTTPIVTPGGLDFAHASGVAVGSATGVNYGAAAALQTASYAANTGLFSFASGSLIIGGSTTTTGGVYTNTGGTLLGFVKNITVTGKNALKTDRWQFGSAVAGEQLENGWRDYKVSIEVDYLNRALVDSYQADAPLAVIVNLTSPTGALLSIYLPVGFLEDGSNPNLSGPDVLGQKLSLTMLDDGTNGSLQIVYTSTDVAV